MERRITGQEGLSGVKAKRKWQRRQNKALLILKTFEDVSWKPTTVA